MELQLKGGGSGDGNVEELQVKGGEWQLKGGEWQLGMAVERWGIGS